MRDKRAGEIHARVRDSSRVVSCRVVSCRVACPLSLARSVYFSALLCSLLDCQNFIISQEAIFVIGIPKETNRCTVLRSDSSEGKLPLDEQF